MAPQKSSSTYININDDEDDEAWWLRWQEAPIYRRLTPVASRHVLITLPYHFDHHHDADDHDHDCENRTCSSHCLWSWSSWWKLYKLVSFALRFWVKFDPNWCAQWERVGQAEEISFTVEWKRINELLMAISSLAFPATRHKNFPLRGIKRGILCAAFAIPEFTSDYESGVFYWQKLNHKKGNAEERHFIWFLVENLPQTWRGGGGGWSNSFTIPTSNQHRPSLCRTAMHILHHNLNPIQFVGDDKTL